MPVATPWEPVPARRQYGDSDGYILLVRRDLSAADFHYVSAWQRVAVFDSITDATEYAECALLLRSSYIVKAAAACGEPQPLDSRIGLK